MLYVFDTQIELGEGNTVYLLQWYAFQTKRQREKIPDVKRLLVQCSDTYVHLQQAFNIRDLVTLPFGPDCSFLLWSSFVLFCNSFWNPWVHQSGVPLGFGKGVVANILSAKRLQQHPPRIQVVHQTRIA